jgi:hypothetical protein
LPRGKSEASTRHELLVGGAKRFETSIRQDTRCLDPGLFFLCPARAQRSERLAGRDDLAREMPLATRI